MYSINNLTKISLNCLYLLRQLGQPALLRALLMSPFLFMWRHPIGLLTYQLAILLIYWLIGNDIIRETKSMSAEGVTPWIA